MLTPAQSNEYFDSAFSASRAMAVLRGHIRERTFELASRAWTVELHLVEVPLQGAVSASALQKVSNDGIGVIGAGTIVSTKLVYQAVGMGARFTVAPRFFERVAVYILSVGLPHLPSASTPTEVQRTMSAGFIWLKAFPAAVLGSDWLAAMHCPFLGARFVAAGGINSENFAQFLESGAATVSLGSSFTALETSALEGM